MKNNLIKIILFNIYLTPTLCLGQVNNKVSKGNDGFRIHSMYAGMILNKPIGGLNDIVPSSGTGFKFGSLFYFYKPGLLKGLFNIGLQTQWLNLEENVPLFRLNEDKPAYSLAAAANLGPVVSFKPNNDMQVDFYYLFGTGFRIFPNQNEVIYGLYVNPDNPHTRFSQSAGFAFHYKALYTGVGLQMLNYRYALSNQTDNLTIRSKFTTLQITVGICGWQVK